MNATPNALLALLLETTAEEVVALTDSTLTEKLESVISVAKTLKMILTFSHALQNAEETPKTTALTLTTLNPAQINATHAPQDMLEELDSSMESVLLVF